MNVERIMIMGTAQVYEAHSRHSIPRANLRAEKVGVGVSCCDQTSWVYVAVFDVCI